MSYYYSFKKIISKGFGARIYEILLAYHYAKSSNLDLHLIKGETWDWFTNYKQSNLNLETNDWHLIFQSLLDLVDVDKVQEDSLWPTCRLGWNQNQPPEYSTQPRIAWYSKLMKELYVLNPAYKVHVAQLVQQSGFKETDIVIHLRLSDKVKIIDQNILPESAEISISWYTDEVVKYINQHQNQDQNQTHRVFICTDDGSAIETVKKLLAPYANIEVVSDINEIRRNGYCPKIFNRQISDVEANDENLTTLKNLKIMTDCDFLVGARSSYLFRVAELLHYPKPCINVKDNDKFGPAEYEDTIPQVRKCQLKAYANFINPIYNTNGNDLERYVHILKTEGIVSIPDFINQTILHQLNDFFQNKMPDKWFNSAHVPNETGGHAPKNIVGDTDSNDPLKRGLIEKARDERSKGLFAYYFYRTLGSHYNTCYCGECRLKDSIESYEFLEFFSRLIGRSIRQLGEVFLSKYQKGNFLTLHHDKGKGRYAYTISFTKEWDPTHGGLLHFWDEKTRTIYKTITPMNNSLTVFYIPEISEGYQRDHFVSEVVGPNKRITLIGWVS